MNDFLSTPDLKMLEAIASITVVVVICAALGFNVVVLLRIWRMLDELAGSLATQSTKLAENVRSARDAVLGMQQAGAQLAALPGQLSAALRSGRPPGGAQLNGLVRQMLDGARVLDDQLRQEMRDLLAQPSGSAETAAPAGGEDDAARDRPRLQRLEQENASLSHRLQSALSTLAELRSEERRLADEEQRVKRLQAQLEQNEQVVRRLRERLVEAEARLVEQSRQSENARKGSQRDAEAIEAERAELIQRLESAEASRRQLEARGAELEATLQRVDREKQLVEQKYLQLDAQLGAP